MYELSGKIADMSLDFKTGRAKLTLELNEKQTAMNMYDELSRCEKLSIKIGKHREKRSLNANNYAWKLITELAEKNNLPKEEVYKKYIKEVGVYKQTEISENAVETLMHSWSLHGIGWFTEKVDYAENDGFVIVNLYYGSSQYNTKQMSRLIDFIVQDCKALGIETKTPNQIAEMLSLWKAGE